MTINSAPPDGSSGRRGPGSATVVSSAPPSWPWRRAALLLAGAAQLITISALVGADPIPATWSSLLLAIAPAPLAAVAGIAVLIAGIAAQVTYTGLFFLPALVALAVAAIKLWREQVSNPGEGVNR